MHILFITDNFPPEVNAPATRTYEHCREWVKAGEKVTVLTCAPNFPNGKVYQGYKNKLYQWENLDGIRVVRLWTYISANKGVLKRSLDYASFGVMAFLGSLFLKCDIIIATSPQFFSALAANSAAFWKRKPWIMEVRDLWPESIKTVEAMKQGFMIRVLQKLEMRMYKRAIKIVVVTESFRDHLTERRIPGSKIYTIKNGANFDLYKPAPKDVGLLKELDLEGKFVIGYIGTHGMAHKLDFILGCAERLIDSDHFRFLFVGDGAEKEKLVSFACKKRLRNVLFLDSIAKQDVPRYLSVLDLALVNLKKSEAFKAVLPSKIFETAAMRIPILLGVEGEAKKLIEKYDAGICFEPENEADFIRQLLVYHTNRERLSPRFQAGCERLAADFDRKTLAKQLLAIIRDTES